MYEVGTVLDILEIVKILRNTLLPWAIVFAVIAFFIYLYQNYIEQDKISEEDTETGMTIVEKAFKSVGVSIVLYLLFPIIALIPIFIISELGTVIESQNPIEELFEEKISAVEAQMESVGYITEENRAQWEASSLETRIAGARIFQANQELQEKYDIQAAKEKFDGLLDGDFAEGPSFWKLVRLDVMDAINYILVTVINWLRNAIEYLIIRVFRFLLYMDYFIGLFTALFSIIPYYRQNLLNWFTENISLLAWSLVFIFVQWIMSFISLRALSNEEQSMDAWVMPLLSIVAYSGIAYYAAKIIGREAGGGTLAQVTRMGMSVIPAVGGAAAGVLVMMKGFGTSKAGQALGGLMKNFSGAAMSRMPQGVQKAISSVGDAADYFKPQSKPTAMERSAAAAEGLLNVFKNE
jgi:hypothetical protein